MSAAPSTKFRFHLVIILWWTPNLAGNAEIVASFFTLPKATLALNLALYFLRLLLISAPFFFYWLRA